MTDFYVDSNGSDGNNGTQGAPWATLEKLQDEQDLSNVAAGDRVFFTAGDSLATDETANGKVWFENGIEYLCTDPVNRPTFTGTGHRPFGTRNTNNPTVRNIILSGGTLSVLHTDGTAPVQCTLDNVAIINGTALGFQQLSGGAAGIDGQFTFMDCTFSDNGTIGMNITGADSTNIRGCTANGNGEVGLRLQSSGAGCLIHGCLAYENGSNGIGIDTPQTGGSGEVVEFCIVHTNAEINDDTSGLKTFSTGTIVRYNRVYNNGLGGSINHGIQLETGSDQCQAYGNLCYGNLTAGISFTNTSHQIYHNTLVDNGDTGLATFSTAITNCIVKNNLLAFNTNYSFRSHGTVTITNLDMDGNLHWGEGSAASIRYEGTDHAGLAAFNSATSQDANGVEGDPLLVAIAAGGFRIQPGSPAYRAGVTGLGIATDIEGRGYGPVPSIGAFEFEQAKRITERQRAIRRRRIYLRVP